MSLVVSSLVGRIVELRVDWWMVPFLLGGSTQIWWTWVRVYLMLFGKEEIFFDERLGLMWNESITAIILKERWDKSKSSSQLWRSNDLH